MGAMTSSPRVRGAAAWGLAAVCAAGVAALLAATAEGVGVTPDSTVYISLARRWLTAFGFAPPAASSIGRVSAEIPPVYPAVLSAVSLLTRQDPVQSARWLGAVLIAANLGAFGALVRRFVPGRPQLWVLGPLLMLGVPDFLVAHSNVWTEPLFLLLLTLGFLALDMYLTTARPAHLMAAVAIGAVASLTRFAGPALVGASCAAILRWGPGTPRRRALSAAAMTLALAPMLIWSIAVPGYRGLALHLPSFEYFTTGWDTVAPWVVPAALPLSAGSRRIAAAGLVGVMLLASACGALRNERSESGSHLPGSLWLFTWLYLLLLLLTRMLWDAANFLEGRLLSPLIVPAAALAVTVLDRVRSAERQIASPAAWLQAVRGASWLLAVGWTVAAGLTSVAWIVRVHETGQWYNSRSWRQSPTMLAVRGLPASAVLISNGNDAIVAVTGRPSLRVPDRTNPATLEPSPEYEAAMAKLYDRLRAGAFLVYLDVVGRERPYIPGEAEILRTWDLSLVTDTEDGAIYRARPKADARAETK